MLSRMLTLVPSALLLAAPVVASAQLKPRILTVTPAGAPASSNVAQIRSYLDGLRELVMVNPNPGHPETMVGLPTGITGRKWVGEEIVNTQAELALLKSFANVTWPGALVQGQTIDKNNFAPLGSELTRSGGRIRLATEFIGATKGLSQSTDLPVMNATAVEDARRRLLQALAPKGSTGTLLWEFETGETLREAMVKMGVAYQGSGISASLDAKLNSHYNEHTFVAKLTQVFYRIVFEPLGDSPFFAPSVTLADVQRLAGPGNPPLYVSEIKYGRILLVKFTGTLDTLDLEAAASAAYSGFKGQGAAAYRQKLSSERMEILSVGGRADQLVGLVFATPDAISQALQSAVQKGITYDPQSNPGDAIGITMNYVASNHVAIAQMLTQASPKIVDLRTVRVCLDTIRKLEDRRGPFPVWDGPGGGQVNTHISVLPGDEVTFEAWGKNWSGVFATGDYGPDGWHTWDKPKDGEGGYPIADRSPFALIAKFGAGNNKGGPDRSKPGYNESTSGAKAASDWFYVGTGRVAVVQQLNAQGEGFQGYGDIYLGTNDNDPTNGDPNKKFTVRICVKRDPKNVEIPNQ